MKELKDKKEKNVIVVLEGCCLYSFRSCWRASCAGSADTCRDHVQTRCASTVVGLVMPSVSAIDDVCGT